MLFFAFFLIVQILKSKSTVAQCNLKTEPFVKSDVFLNEASDVVKVGDYYYTVQDDVCFITRVSFIFVSLFLRPFKWQFKHVSCHFKSNVFSVFEQRQNPHLRFFLVLLSNISLRVFI